MLFFCVQSFDVSSVLLQDIERVYPELWMKVVEFKKNVFHNLKSYYEIGIEIGFFKSDSNPLLLTLQDQQFFDLLSNHKIIVKNNIDVLTAFDHHYKTKFNGILT